MQALAVQQAQAPCCRPAQGPDSLPGILPLLPPAPCAQFYGLSEGEVTHFGERVAGGAAFGAYWVRAGRVVGAFLEGGSPDQFGAIKKVAAQQPEAPADLAARGVEFAMQL